MPLGSEIQGDVGSSKGNRPKQQQASKESQKVESAMREIKSLVARLEDRISRSPSAKSNSGKGDPSCLHHYRSVGVAVLVVQTLKVTEAVQCPGHHPVGRVRTHMKGKNGLCGSRDTIT